MRNILIAAALALTACATTPAPASPPITLTGEITRADHQTYRELPFTVPAGATRISIDFTYDKDNRTVIDLGLRDPQGQRGWSGGNKAHIEVGASDATPSYRPGAIQPGEWKLILGVPNIRDGQTSRYAATITLSTTPVPATAKPVAYAPTTLAAAPGWRRGDFHAHTAHSDGSCAIAGARAPCPSIHTFEAARDAGLDFIAITDHNTITQLADIAAQQRNFPNTLLIPGTEITSFFGHANVIGNTSFLDFQLGSPHLPTLAKLFDEASAQDAFVSINHPGLPSGEICMGCGWTADTDWSRVTAIEIANGSSVRTTGPAAGIRFWNNLLKQGYRLTAIGGSDNHDATDRTGARQPPIGFPVTAVYSSSLSPKAIIDGVRSGRVFIDLANLPGATFDISANAGQQTVRMGDRMTLGPNEAATINTLASGLPAGATLTLVAHNLAINGAVTPQLDNAPTQVSITLTTGATSAYIRHEIRDGANKILLIGNPIYVSPP